MLERLISKKPFVVFSSSPVSSSQAPLPPAPSADLFGAGDNCQERELVQKMSFKDLEKEIIRVSGLRTKFYFEQQLKLEKRILEVVVLGKYSAVMVGTLWYWVSTVSTNCQCDICFLKIFD